MARDMRLAPDRELNTERRAWEGR